MRIKKPIQERMAGIGWDEVSRVDPLGPCWEWRGAISTSGYARVATGGRAGSIYAHRQMLSDALGRPLHAGMIACHRCDNRRCVNPAHLYEGTYSSNARDVVAAKGEHGTYAGYQAHKRWGQASCDECREANRQYEQARRERVGREADRRYSRARNRATSRLVSEYRGEFEKFLREELEPSSEHAMRGTR